MFKSVAKAKWENVILDADKKKAVQDDVIRFFESRARYNKLNVPWKRGVIYYGPPGNGKTISIKALMNQLANLPDPVPSLYVRSLVRYLLCHFQHTSVTDTSTACLDRSMPQNKSSIVPAEWPLVSSSSKTSTASSRTLCAATSSTKSTACSPTTVSS